MKPISFSFKPSLAPILLLAVVIAGWTMSGSTVLGQTGSTLQQSDSVSRSGGQHDTTLSPSTGTRRGTESQPSTTPGKKQSTQKTKTGTSTGSSTNKRIQRDTLTTPSDIRSRTGRSDTTIIEQRYDTTTGSSGVHRRSGTSTGTGSSVRGRTGSTQDTSSLSPGSTTRRGGVLDTSLSPSNRNWRTGEMGDTSMTPPTGRRDLSDTSDTSSSGIMPRRGNIDTSLSPTDMERRRGRRDSMEVPPNRSQINRNDDRIDSENDESEPADVDHSTATGTGLGRQRYMDDTTTSSRDVEWNARNIGKGSEGGMEGIDTRNTPSDSTSKNRSGVNSDQNINTGNTSRQGTGTSYGTGTTTGSSTGTTKSSNTGMLSARLVNEQKNAQEKAATVQVTVNGVRITDPAETNELPKEGQAHIHYQIDDGPVIATTSTKLSFHNLKSGNHKIMVMLAGNDHKPLGPPEILDVRIP